MYEDDFWHRRFTQAVEEHLPDFTDKQLRRFQLDLMLRIAKRVRDNSDKCETCRSFQETLTLLEAELQELSDSRAQRQYQRKQLDKMAEHYVKEHDLAPPGYYLRKGVLYGLIAGSALGVVIGLAILGAPFYLPLSAAGGALLGGLVGSTLDAKVKQEHRLI